jgi:hypothetical protein
MPQALPRLLVLACLLAGSGLAGSSIDSAFLEAHQERLDFLFRQLDPHHPATGPIRERWNAGDRLPATRDLARHLGNRTFPTSVLDPIEFPPDLLERADAALQDRFFLIDRWQRVPRIEGRLDWRFRGRRDDKEWAWMLNRHDFFPILAEAHRRTGDPRYRAALNELWTDWITANPYPDRLSFSAPWRALEVARRILNAWMQTVFNYDVLDPGTRLLVLASLAHHGDALREHASFWGGNHLITEKLALLALATAWPELRLSSEWQSYATRSVSREILRQTYPDGSYKELSNHYQRVVLVNAHLFLKLLAESDPGYRDHPVFSRIEAMWDFFARSTRPDGTGPLNNAADLELNTFFLDQVWAFYDRPDWLHIASGAAEGSIDPGRPASVLFPWAGQAFLRSGWNPRAHWAYFDAGPYGTAHQHIDRFHLSASLKGRPLLVDTGRYIYRPGPWKDYFQGPAGHNILLLDGEPAVQGPRAVRSPLPIAFQTGEEWSFSAARAHFQPGPNRPLSSPTIPWTRAVLLDNRGFILVIDHLVSFGQHDLEAGWHFHPDVSLQEARAALRLVSPANFGPPNSARGRISPSVAGFYSPDYNQRLPAIRLAFNASLNQPTTLIWILQPPETPRVTVTVSSPPGDPILRFQLRQNNHLLATASLPLHPQPGPLSYSIPPQPDSPN